MCDIQNALPSKIVDKATICKAVFHFARCDVENFILDAKTKSRISEIITSLHKIIHAGIIVMPEIF